MATFYRVRTIFSGVQGAPWLSTLYFGSGAGTAQQAANAVGLFWGDVDSRMATTVVWATEAEVVTINEVDGKPVSSTATTPVTGAGAGAAAQLPIVTQGLLRLRTGAFPNGREVKGRIFIPGLTENDNDLGVPGAPIQNVVNAAAATLVGTGTASWFVMSRANSLAFEVTSATMAPYWSYLRTRRD